MPDTPLNPDGVRAAEELMIRTDRITKINYLDAERIISAYLAAALPEVTSVEELDQLPVGSVVRGGEDDLVGEKIHFRPYLPHWCTIGEEVEADKRDLIPARVLYRPVVNDA